LRTIETSSKGCSGHSNYKTIVLESLPRPILLGPINKLERNTLKGRSYEVIGRPGSAFLWEAENGSIVLGQGNSNVIINWFDEQNLYHLKVRETTYIGCIAETDQSQIHYDSTLFIPNLITPNGDGKNDRFEIKNIHFYPNNELAIYNRWGKEVVSFRSYKQDWPSEPIDSGMYFFLFKSDNSKINGCISVIK